MRLEYFGHVDEKAILHLTNRNGFSSDLRDFAGKEVRITIEPKSKRSNDQNRFFHGVLIPIIKAHLIDLGWKEAKSTEWVKDYVKYHCLIKEYVNEDSGECIKSLGKTSGLSTKEFKEFIEDVQRWSVEHLDLVLPDPGQKMKLDL